jgi:hypothetical protein
MAQTPQKTRGETGKAETGKSKIENRNSKLENSLI